MRKYRLELVYDSYINKILNSRVLCIHKVLCMEEEVLHLCQFFFLNQFIKVKEIELAEGRESIMEVPSYR